MFSCNVCQCFRARWLNRNIVVASSSSSKIFTTTITCIMAISGTLQFVVSVHFWFSLLFFWWEKIRVLKWPFRHPTNRQIALVAIFFLRLSTDITFVGWCVVCFLAGEMKLCAVHIVCCFSDDSFGGRQRPALAISCVDSNFV